MHRISKGEEPRHFTDWKNKFRTDNGREPTYDDLRGTAEYYHLKRSLLEEQGYICCYCEKAIGRGSDAKDCNIEHFMPRHPDSRCLSSEECQICSNAELDYSNLFASCLVEKQESTDHCNHKKDNWFDFKCCISPASAEIEGIFGFRLNGKIFAVDNNPAAEAMKQHLNLDTYILQEQRKAAYDTVLETEFTNEELEDADLLEDEQYLLDTIAYYEQKDENGKYTPFTSMITYCLREYEL